MISRERASVLTGTAFPIGAILGVVFGNLTAPASTGGGFGDIVYAIMWFILGAPLLTSLTYALATRTLVFEGSGRRKAAFRVAQGIFLATGVLLVMVMSLSRGVGAIGLLIGLPLSALVVTLFTRSALRG